MDTDVIAVDFSIAASSVPPNHPNVETVTDNRFLSPVTSGEFCGDIGVINAIDRIVDGCIPEPIKICCFPSVRLLMESLQKRKRSPTSTC